MSQIIWRIKEALTKLVAVALVGAVAWGGYSLYRQGAFRKGFSHASRVVFRQIPYFGSRFKHFIGSGPSRHEVSYRNRSKSYRGRSYHKSRKFSAGSRRRGRRHR